MLLSVGESRAPHTAPLSAGGLGLGDGGAGLTATRPGAGLANHDNTSTVKALMIRLQND